MYSYCTRPQNIAINILISSFFVRVLQYRDEVLLSLISFLAEAGVKLDYRYIILAQYKPKMKIATGSAFAFFPLRTRSNINMIRLRNAV
jgi:hypothetical protein